MKKQLEEGWQRVEFYAWCESGRGELQEQAAAAAVEIYWIISSERRRTDTTNRSGDGPWSISHAATNTMLCHYHRLYFLRRFSGSVSASNDKKTSWIFVSLNLAKTFANVDITSICGRKLKKKRGRKCLVKNIHQKRARITTAHCLAAQQFNFSKFRRRDVSNRHFLLSLLLNIILPPS